LRKKFRECGGNVGFIAGEKMETEVEAGMVGNSPAHWG
jgi:hypothetical protein